MFLRPWSNLTTNPVILKWVRGFKIPFSSVPVQHTFSERTDWSKNEISSIRFEIDKLIKKGAIERVAESSGQFLSNIFLVPKPDGSQRFILNLKKLNEFVVAEHFKIEDWRVVKSLIGPGDFMASIDIKAAYYHVSIAKKHHRFLRFRFQGECYEFIFLPFGLSVAPYTFTKLLKPMAAFLRKQGFISVFYWDDILVMGKSYKDCASNFKTTLTILEELGFVINKEKCYEIPAQRCQYLGLIFDSSRMTMVHEKGNQISYSDC